jgi:hypothetical protein
VAVSLSAASVGGSAAVGALTTAIPVAASTSGGTTAAGSVLVPIPISGHAEGGSSAAGELTLPLPAGAEGELLGFNAAGEVAALSITTLLERLVAATPPAGETYTLEEV